MKVYLDLDGVIADFFSAAVKYSNAEHAAWRDMEFRDVERVLGIIRHKPGFFRTLPVFPMANTLVKSIVNIAGECRIMSSPLKDFDRCKEEKIEWVKEFIHYDMDEIIITSDKSQYAAGNILIDDYGYNCRKWEEAGGYAIKYQADEQNISDVLIPLQALFKNQR